MKLQDCTYGTLVCELDKDGKLERVGVVVGITTNCSSASIGVRGDPARAIPEVKWTGCSYPNRVHYKNLTKFKDSMLKDC